MLMPSHQCFHLRSQNVSKCPMWGRALYSLSWVTSVKRIKGLKQSHSHVHPHSLLSFISGDLKNYQQNTFLGRQRALCCCHQGPVAPASGMVVYLSCRELCTCTTRPRCSLHLASTSWGVSSYLSTLHWDNMDVPSLCDSLHSAIPSITISSEVPSTISSRSSRNECK